MEGRGERKPRGRREPSDSLTLRHVILSSAPNTANPLVVTRDPIEIYETIAAPASVKTLESSATTGCLILTDVKFNVRENKTPREKEEEEEKEGKEEGTDLGLSRVERDIYVSYPLYPVFLSRFQASARPGVSLDHSPRQNLRGT